MKKSMSALENQNEEKACTRSLRRYSIISTEEIGKIFNTSALTKLETLTICFSAAKWMTSYEGSVFAIVNQIPQLKALKIGIARNYLERPVKLSSLVNKLESCLKTLERLAIDMEISLEDFTENKTYFKNLKVIEFAGDMTELQGFGPLLKSCENLEKISLFQLKNDFKLLSAVMESIATNAKVKTLILNFVDAQGFAYQDLLTLVKYFIEKVEGVKWMWIEFEAGLRFKEEDTSKIRDALENSSKSLETFQFKIGNQGFMEFHLKDNSYVLTHYNFNKSRYAPGRFRLMANLTQQVYSYW